MSNVSDVAANLAENLLRKVVTKALLKVGLSTANPLGAIVFKIVWWLLGKGISELKFFTESYSQLKEDLKTGKLIRKEIEDAQTDDDILDAFNRSR